jgi:uncharacterized protein involved in exopolysaccharide biosynthesis
MNGSLGPERFGPDGCRGLPRRRWPIMLGLAVLGLAAAAVYVAVVPRAVPQSSTASAVVDLPTQAGPGEGIVLIPGLVPDLHGQAQAVRSIRVAAIAGRMMHSALPPRALSNRVTVTVAPGSWLLDIACADPSVIRAATCANDFAKAYLQSRDRSVTNLLGAQVNTLQREVSSLDHARATLKTKIAAMPPTSSRSAADEAQLTSDNGQLRVLTQLIRTKAGQLRTAPAPGSILTFATPPAKPSSPSDLLALPAGLVAGLLLGLITAFLPARRDRRTDGTGSS